VRRAHQGAALRVFDLLIEASVQLEAEDNTVCNQRESDSSIVCRNSPHQSNRSWFSREESAKSSHLDTDVNMKQPTISLASIIATANALAAAVDNDEIASKADGAASIDMDSRETGVRQSNSNIFKAPLNISGGGGSYDTSSTAAAFVAGKSGKRDGSHMTAASNIVSGKNSSESGLRPPRPNGSGSAFSVASTGPNLRRGYTNFLSPSPSAASLVGLHQAYKNHSSSSRQSKTHFPSDGNSQTRLRQGSVESEVRMRRSRYDLLQGVKSMADLAGGEEAVEFDRHRAEQTVGNHHIRNLFLPLDIYRDEFVVEYCVLLAETGGEHINTV